MIDPNYDFTAPLKLVTIFRELPYREKEDGETDEELLHELGIKVGTKTKREDWEELTGDVYVRWEDIYAIKTYPYKDDFKKFKGDKFYIDLEGQDASYLVYGNIYQILEYWAEYRKKYAKLM